MGIAQHLISFWVAKRQFMLIINTMTTPINIIDQVKKKSMTSGKKANQVCRKDPDECWDKFSWAVFGNLPLVSGCLTRVNHQIFP